MTTRGTSCERYSRRALRTLAAFGLTVDDVGADEESRRIMGERAAILASRVIDALPDGRIGVITGPSGAGKSTVLRGIGEKAAAHGSRVVSVGDGSSLGGSRRRSIDLVARALGYNGRGRTGDEAAMRLLASAGLADARLAIMPACELSEGERIRLALAIAMGECRGSAGAMLLVDEFGASLDEVTAISVAIGLKRWFERSGVRAAIVTHRREVVRALGPRVIVRLRAGWIHGRGMQRAA